MIVKRIPKVDTTLNRIDFGSVIKQARTECGLSQKELAEQVGFESATAISLIESNDRGVSSKIFFQLLEITQYPLEQALKEMNLITNFEKLN